MFKTEIKLDEVTTHGPVFFKTKELAQEWITENAECFPENYTVEIKDVAAELQAEKEKLEALKYLADTDWYVIRAMETHVAIPADVLTKRAEARLLA